MRANSDKSQFVSRQTAGTRSSLLQGLARAEEDFHLPASMLKRVSFAHVVSGSPPLDSKDFGGGLQSRVITCSLSAHAFAMT